MRLKKGQKEAVLKWIAAGLESDEINEWAAEFASPFNVSRGQVQFYRRTRQIDIEAIKKGDEYKALNEGLALKTERIKKLKQLATLMEGDLFGGLLWVEDVKGVGSGEIAQIVDFEEFNKSEVDAYRGVLDDIAKELGERALRQEVTGREGEPVKVEFIEVVKSVNGE